MLTTSVSHFYFILLQVITIHTAMHTLMAVRVIIIIFIVCYFDAIYLKCQAETSTCTLSSTIYPRIFAKFCQASSINIVQHIYINDYTPLNYAYRAEITQKQKQETSLLFPWCLGGGSLDSKSWWFFVNSGKRLCHQQWEEDTVLTINLKVYMVDCYCIYSWQK